MTLSDSLSTVGDAATLPSVARIIGEGGGGAQYAPGRERPLLGAMARHKSTGHYDVLLARHWKV